jgi:hypothetical protein
MNKIVNQHNSCALVIISFQNTANCLTNPVSWQTLFISKCFDFLERQRVKMYFDTKVFPNYFIYKMGIYS